MSLKIRNHLLTGPFEIAAAVVRANQDPAVFAIVCKGGEPWNPTFRLVDVGDTGENGMKFADHPDRAAWERTKDGKVGVYFLPFPRKEGHTAADRVAAVRDIREAMAESGGMILIQGNI